MRTQRIVDMSLFTPKYASDNEKIALSALDRISDYPTLRKIADPYTAKNRARLKVRAEAALKMKDKDLFADTVCADRDVSAFSLYYRVVVFIDPLQGLCYTVKDAVDWYHSPTA